MQANVTVISPTAEFYVWNFGSETASMSNVFVISSCQSLEVHNSFF